MNFEKADYEVFDDKLKLKSNFRNSSASLPSVHSVECDSYAAIYHETSFLIIQSVLRGTHANKTGRKKRKDFSWQFKWNTFTYEIWNQKMNYG